ncbi:MAG: hypothetical protein KDB03_24575, partial [Planctomycetales bacterium]|nr:hypothetical protein [Planctomycetales bacterium]
MPPSPVVRGDFYGTSNSCYHVFFIGLVSNLEFARSEYLAMLCFAKLEVCKVAQRFSRFSVAHLV